jgi:hypothetical protein
VRVVLVATLAALAMMLSGSLASASDQGVVVAHSVQQTSSIDRSLVEQLPAIDQQVAFQTNHGAEQATYAGALLWDVLGRVGGLDADPRARVHQTVMITGRDGYLAVLALAEIDPEFEGKRVLLAYRKDGQPMAANELRLVVPGERRGGRSVRDVVRIEIR